MSTGAIITMIIMFIIYFGGLCYFAFKGPESKAKKKAKQAS